MSPKKKKRQTHKIPDRAILVVLAQQGPIRMSSIAKQLGVTRQAISYRLQHLERLKIAARIRGSQGNANPDLWFLTPASERLGI